MTTDERLFFHELTDDEYEALVDSKITWKELLTTYRAPIWCGCGDTALDPMGCWGLIGRFLKDESYCKECEYHE